MPAVSPSVGLVLQPPEDAFWTDPPTVFSSVVDWSLHAVRWNTTEGAIDPVIPPLRLHEAPLSATAGRALAALLCSALLWPRKATPNKQRVGNEEANHGISASRSGPGLAPGCQPVGPNPATTGTVQPMTTIGLRNLGALNLHASRFRCMGLSSSCALRRFPTIVQLAAL